MKANRRRTMVKWFLIGFGVRAFLAVVLTLWQLIDWEAVMLYLADLPTMLFFDGLDVFFPDSVSRALEGSHPFYIPMNVIGSFLWGGIFMLVPLVYKLACWLRRPRPANT